ncbi:Hpt domain-containing protein [Arthrobacter sp. NPDC058288]|uniref:Hpt domain-containing protein n=1 Tax=Arthrobacter sp. NPDC058288 TaxID=3346424 RepID=UPI0036EECD95
MSISGSYTEGEGADHIPALSPAAAAPGTEAGAAFEEIPLVDLLVLQDLESQLAQPAIARKFALDYIEIWEQRFLNLTNAIIDQDLTTALDAAISLKIGSAMVGGLRLARLAEDIESVIRSGSWDAGQSMLAGVSNLGHETVTQLRLSYLPAA